MPIFERMKPNHLQKSWFLLTCLLFISLTCFADTFIVTSNADSGPGTLREAITLANANGTVVMDSIHFNIADQSEAGRTITLASRLPSLTSNIVIDGSTQQGSLLGWSTAKVILYLNRFTEDPFVFLFIDNATDVNIYGLCFSFFNDPVSGGGLNYAILLRKASKIKIGGPGKGNLFYGVRFGVTNEANFFSNDVVNDLIIQSNVFGLLKPDGERKRSGTLLTGYNITIGGEFAQEGNRFIGSALLIHEPASYSSDLFLKFSNNIFNTSPDGSQFIIFEGGGLELWGQRTTFTPATKTIISNNVISGYGEKGMGINLIKNTITVTGNKLGTDLTGTKCWGNRIDIFSQGSPGLTIGGHMADEENIITGNISTPLVGTHIIKNQIGGYIQETTNPPAGHPFIKILTYDNGLITGAANPNAKIQLYKDECFGNCTSKKYFATTYADAQGNWSFNYDASTPNLSATSTRTDSSTSSFSKPRFDESTNPKITNSSCGKNNGSATGVKILEGTHFGWYNSNTGQLVSTDTNLLNVPAGNYYLRIKNGANGCPLDKYIRIENISVPETLNPQVRIIQPSCGLNNGTIVANEYGDFYASAWFNNNMDTIGKNYFINNLFEGTYYWKIWIKSDTSCSKLFGPFSLTNQSGPTLNLNSLQITDASCGNNNGSITGISSGGNVAGMPYIAWVDSLNRVVANTYDINNLKAGKYRFKFKDQGGCDTIITPFYTINSTGIINIDISQLSITPSQCNTATGAIKNIIVTGASSYQWHNSAGQVISNTADPGTLLPGKYVLKVSNAGCTKQTDSIAVPVNPLMQLNYPLQTNGIPGKCDAFNGSLEVINFQNSQDFTFRWVDSMQPSNTLSTSLQLTGIRSGTYLLYAKNKAGCEQQVGKYTLRYLPPPQLNEASVKITNEICDNAGGAIEGIVNVTDKGIAPFSFTWLNNANATIASSQNLSGVSAGNYRLLITDRLGCTDTSSFFTIQNNNINLNKPVYSNQMIRSNNSVTLTPQNTQPGTYKLYNDLLSTTPVSENNNGIFSTGILTSTTTYYIEIVNGSCKSERVAVIINVYDKTIVYVPTAFSPNKDGLNDKINPIALGPVKLTYFKIYNRWGQQVFETSELQKAWDGLFKGEPQPSSNYQWILLAKDEMSGEVIKMSGSFLLIR